MSRRFSELSTSFPVEERYSLTDRGRRSSRSIGAQIAEAWAKRGYEKHFVSDLERIGRMLQSMMDKAGQFCGSSASCVREGTAEYFVDRSPITDHRPPITDHRPPITDHRSPITDHRSPE